TQRLVDSHEIIKSKMQSNRGFQIVELLRESIRQPRHASDRHAHREVLAFHVRSRNVLCIRFALSDLGYNLDDWAWGVFCSVVMLAIISVQFRQSGKVHIGTKGSINRIDVEAETVCSELDALAEALREIVNKLSGVGSGALTDDVRRHQLGFCINGDEYPSISEFGRVVAAMPLFLANESPDFIALDIVALESAHTLIHELCAPFASQDQQLHDGVAMQPCHALRGANRAAFNEALNSADGVLFRDAHGSERANGFGVRKSCGAGCAAVTLDSLPSVAAKLFNGGVLA